jgi:hypothetical protein
MNKIDTVTAEGYSYNIESFYTSSRDTGAELNKFRILEQLRKKLDVTTNPDEALGLRVAIEIVRAN